MSSTVAARLRQLAEAAEAAGTSNAELITQLTQLAGSLASGNQQACTQLAADAEPCGSNEAGPSGQQPPAVPMNKRQRRAGRELDFSKYCQRYVALELMYLGQSFQGFARQEATDNTIEAALFSALRRTKLIPETADISTLQYSRCGRTDKGVSALGQVVALMLRSSAKVDAPPNTSPPSAPAHGEAAHSDAAAPHHLAQPDTARSMSVDGTSTLPGAGMEGKGPTAQDGTAPGGQRDEAQRAGPSDSTAVRERWERGPVVLPTPEEIAALGLPPADQELDYPRILNRSLPPEIRVLGWTTVPRNFNARYSAQYREYKYFIVNRDKALDVAAMQAAALRFVGEHDFRNFCKADVTAVKSFVRAITSFTLDPWGATGMHVPHPSPPPVPALHVGPAGAHVVGPTGGQDRNDVLAFTVRGSAFLWHQVRYMVAVLLLIGQGLEPPEVITRMLDVTQTPRKPCYTMAPEEPLLLYACGFEGLSFTRTNHLALDVARHVRALGERHLITAAMTSAIAARLATDDAIAHGEAQAVEVQTHADVSASDPPARGQQQAKKRKTGEYVPLLQRPVESSVEERMRKHDIAQLGQKRALRGEEDAGDE